MTPTERAVLRARAVFVRRHKAINSKTGLRCKCGYSTPAGVRGADAARLWLAHLRVDQAASTGLPVTSNLEGPVAS